MSDDSAKQQIFSFMAQAQEQQKNIDRTIEIMNKQQAQLESFHKQLPNLAQQLFTDSLDGARASIESDLNNHATKAAQDLRLASREAMQATQEIREALTRLSWKFGFLYVGGLLAVTFALLLGLVVYVPSLDDIADRRATVAELDRQNGDLDVSYCDGKICARVMTKKCNYGQSKDYCVLDLKD